MYLKNLYLRNFRNYLEARLSFSKKINVISGNNAQGKTNLLEAIYLLSMGRSFRTFSMQDLIHHEKTYFYIEAEFIKSEVSQTIKIFYSKEKRQLFLNQTLLSSFTQLFGLLPSILIAPQDTQLITSHPSFRRRFLNLHIAQYDPLYVHHLVRFWKILKQRNALLKKNNLQNIEYFEEAMYAPCAYLTEKRKLAIQSLQDPLELFSKKFTSSHFQIEYFASMPSLKQEFLNKMKNSRSRELKMKTTLHGPHRDDFIFQVDQKKAKLFASEGQKRVFISALKFAQWISLSNHIQEKSLVCIDDFGVHLDSEKYDLLKKQVQDLSQVFITSPVSFGEKEIRSFQVSSGKIFS